MTAPTDPTICRLRLCRALKIARASTRLSQRDVANALDWSPSKLLRIENGSVGISTTDLRALVSLYGIDDPDQVVKLTTLAQGARRPTPYAYRDAFVPEFVAYLRVEGAASVIYQWEPFVVPGLLQIEAYARRLIENFPTNSSPDIVERQIEARLSRQDLLKREDPPEVHFILGETAVRQRVGSVATTLSQLKYLREVSDLPKVSIQIVPFAAGEHPTMTTPFVVLEFPDPEDGALLYLESPRSGVLAHDEGDDLASYLTSFWRLGQHLALDVTASKAFLDREIARSNS